MRLLALSLFSLGLAANSAAAQVSNGTVPLPPTLAGQNVGSVNASMGRSNGFPTAGISTPQSPSASPGTVPSGDGTVRSVVPPAPSGIPPSGTPVTPPPNP
jgi:hypothetical protein